MPKINKVILRVTLKTWEWPGDEAIRAVCGPHVACILCTLCMW